MAGSTDWKYRLMLVGLPLAMLGTWLGMIDPVKFVRLKLTNHRNTARAVVVTYYAEVVLGVTREQHGWHRQSQFDETSQALLIRNPYHPEYGQQTVFVKLLGEAFSYTTDRAEFLGRNGHWESAQGASTVGLNRRTGVAWDRSLSN